MVGISPIDQVALPFDVRHEALGADECGTNVGDPEDFFLEQDRTDLHAICFEGFWRYASCVHRVVSILTREEAMKDGFANCSVCIRSSEVPQFGCITGDKCAGHLHAQLPSDLELIELVFCDRHLVNWIDPSDGRIPDEAHGDVAQFTCNERALSERHISYWAGANSTSVPDSVDVV